MYEARVYSIRKGEDLPYVCRRDSLEEVEKWLARQLSKKACPFGLPKRTIHEDSASEQIKQRVLTKEKGKDGKWLLTVKPDYRIEIWKIQSYKEKRKAEYPTMDEILEALIENMELRPEKLNKIKEQRKAVRQKYPKDDEELLEIR